MLHPEDKDDLECNQTDYESYWIKSRLKQWTQRDVIKSKPKKIVPKKKLRKNDLERLVAFTPYILRKLEGD